MALNSVISAITAALIAVTVSSGASGMAEVTPEEAATAFLDGMKAGDRQVIASYIDNQYVNALESADAASAGGGATTSTGGDSASKDAKATNAEDRDSEASGTEGDSALTIRQTVFENLKYEIEDSATKGEIAVVKLSISNKDFSTVMENYEKASYKYVMDNLYDKNIEDKAKLSAKCLNIYEEELAKVAVSDSYAEKEIFIAMEADGYCGWRIILNDEIMMAMMGELELPIGETKGEAAK